MKHFMQPRNPILRENNPCTDAAASPSPSPSSSKQRSNRKQKSKENSPPLDLNSMPEYSQSPAVAGKPSPVTGKLKSPLPPRPPNPPKRKLNLDALTDDRGFSGSSDSGVQVIVRMRPPNKDEEEGEIIAQKTSGDSLSIAGQTFTFDSVADCKSTQLDIFQHLGAPLVENCLAGFNSSVFAYGQTGSGKTYTIWGPANALLEENLSSDQQGLTPRVFDRLFSRIAEEQNKHTDKQLRYQCRCSFLEIYNEQITDLLDPSQKNLQIREDVKTGVYVENLREECVCTMKDVTQLLMKGLANRRTGATSINAESSRSHSVFTCIVESRCKGLSDGLSCFKSSRINLVDLAGSERQKLTGAAGERLKEAGNINRSLSQLGNLINILAEVSQTGKQRHIPYRDSKLTFLLQESLGGNAKLAMVCAISPAQSCKSETFSTLRFAQRAKAIKNKAVVNEEMQDDVNLLRDIIRQLKDELHRVKQNGNQSEPNGCYSTGWNARRSLNLLKFSLNRPITVSHIDDDGDEEMEIVEHAAQISLLLAGIEENNAMDGRKLERVELVDSKLSASTEGLQNSSVRVSIEELVDGEKNYVDTTNIETLSKKETGESQESTSAFECNKEQGSKGAYVNMESEILEQAVKHSWTEDLSGSVKMTSNSGQPDLDCNLLNEEILTSNISDDSADLSNLGIVTHEVSPVLKSPTPSISPRPSDISRKSLITKSTLSASQKNLRDQSLTPPETIHLSFAKPPSKSIGSNTQSTVTSQNYTRPSEHLAASLHRGLEILDRHRESSGLRRSSFRFSYKPGDIKKILQIQKVDVGVQTLLQDNEAAETAPAIFLCSKCNSRSSQGLEEAHDGSNLQLVTVDDVSYSAEKSMKQVPKAVEKVLAGAIRREMALEEYCTKQNSEIMQLNRLVQQYKHERECNAIIGQTREDKIARLESLMDGILSTEDFMEDELISLKDENKILKDKYENHPELLSTKIELKRVQDKLEQYRSFHDMGERDVLVEEIQDLRSQLQYYTDTSPKSARKRSPLLQLKYPCEPSVSPTLSPIPESTHKSAEQKLETERMIWTETESKWISLAEELRAELDANRVVVEKLKEELEMEKKCSEELTVSMQMAMEGHARMIEQYADLQEKHVQLLDRHRKIQDGIEDVKKAAAKAGVRGAESKFINTLAAEISALRVEREKERRYLMDENRGLQAQLRDTAEAVQAAGELLVRLKEAEEAVALAENRAAEAEQETEKAYKQINKLKRKHEEEVSSLNQLLSESHLPRKAARPVYDDAHVVKYDAGGELEATADEQWRDEFKPFYNAAEPSSWFSGYDRCNI